jgi:carbamoyltransferase
LSAYGKNSYADLMRRLIEYSPQRGLKLNLEYFRHHKSDGSFETINDGTVTIPPLWSEKLEDDLGPVRRPDQDLTTRDRDVAASMQIRFEEVFLEMVGSLVATTGLRDIVMSGGAALNSVANGRMITEGLVDRAYFQPAASDDGTAVGAASYVLHAKHRIPRAGAVNHAFWGSAWPERGIESALKDNGRSFRRYSEAEIIQTAARSIADGKIVGWFQGREEWGPRALGNRSILCNPAIPDMKETLNSRIKNREPFRPFAPVCREEDLTRCFQGEHPVPFMITVYKVRPEWRARIPAVTHEDNTGRVQTVSFDQNEKLYQLICEFEKLTGVPVLLNTSFNENEPIVHTPNQAIECFERTKMDALGIGPFWIEK